MQRQNTHAKIKLTLQGGLPSNEFLAKAWASEPLTNVLVNTDIGFALPTPDEDISLLAKNENDVVIGQCSANRIEKYWYHIDSINLAKQNRSTQLFIAIQKKAVAIEKSFLEEKSIPMERVFHSAGIAVLPEYRGKNIGLAMRAEQINICQKNNASWLFCETTNAFSEKTVREQGFTQLASFTYKLLAEELNCEELEKLDGSFSVWCRRI